MDSTTENKLKELFNNFTHVLKYIVIFILYVFAFNYMYINNTLPISFILLLILHISILYLIRLDFKIFSGGYNYSIFYNNIGFLFGLLTFLGPFLCWVMVFIALALIISTFDRLKFYKNIGNTVDLEEIDEFELSIIKILVISSTIIFAILYGFVYSGLLKNPIREGVQLFLSLNENSNLIPRLIMTTILLISFVVYFLLVNVSNITIGLGISFIVFLYFFNFIYHQFRNKIIDRFLVIIYILSILIICGGLIYSCYFKVIEYFYALIPSFVWLFYIYYIIYPDKRVFNKSTESNKSNIYLFSSFVVILYIISLLLLYYAAVVRGFLG